jgi:hypothetical protein
LCTAEHLAFALVSAGLGASAWPGLHRVHAVPKSATAPPGSRPTVDLHYESFSIEQIPASPTGIILIDDVVTKGRTLLAAASRLHEAFPRAQIRAFALLRTMGLTPGIAQFWEPCKGQIRWSSGDAHRSP